ncbi:hypothetical protein K435DRAFT_840568 [Dendrothele bispora CBS 962.96]|uniref:Uncharacterized protein n=1 Tax=Dendrothele bispora (strain CBS 962.96) TaxID=1314807 RepID=A0A4S8LT84_DENBC|nr:hypothetical protein K435DRAFT_840568 [Dendrothele bispora CBS 962.96]
MSKDELNKAYMELGNKLDREKDDHSTKEAIKPLTYDGVGVSDCCPLFNFPLTCNFNSSLRFTGGQRVHQLLIIVVRLRGGCKGLMSLRGGGNAFNLELREGKKKFGWYTSWKWQ